VVEDQNFAATRTASRTLISSRRSALRSPRLALRSPAFPRLCYLR